MSDPTDEYGLDKVWEKIQDDLELAYGDALSDEYDKRVKDAKNAKGKRS